MTSMPLTAEGRRAVWRARQAAHRERKRLKLDLLEVPLCGEDFAAYLDRVGLADASTTLTADGETDLKVLADWASRILKEIISRGHRVTDASKIGG